MDQFFGDYFVKISSKDVFEEAAYACLDYIDFVSGLYTIFADFAIKCALDLESGYECMAGFQGFHTFLSGFFMILKVLSTAIAIIMTVARFVQIDWKCCCDCFCTKCGFISSIISFFVAMIILIAMASHSSFHILFIPCHIVAVIALIALIVSCVVSLCKKKKVGSG